MNAAAVLEVPPDNVSAAANEAVAPVPAVAALELQGVGKGYGRGRGRAEVLENVNLSVAEGEFVAIVGFSGSGKTTLISLLAGLIAPDAGTIHKQGRPIGGPGPDRGVVFQNYSLMPWGTVADNVALAVNSVFASTPQAERDARVARYVEMVGLGPARDKRPAELSGGMRQRVAVARALSANPDVLLLDEPLSALDALTRAKLQDEIVRIWGQEKKTVVMITNDVDEALIMADRIIPLNPGPRASLGPAFGVGLARPRDRRLMNNDQRFVALRREVTQYLVDASHRRPGTAGNVISLPSLVPQADNLAKGGVTRLFGKAREGAAQVKPAEAAHGSERYVDFTRLCKTYPSPKGPQKVVEGFDLRIRKGEFVSVIGHSGCGKSTVLSMAAGLVDVTAGAIILDGREVSGAGPDRGIVFQSPSLVPWLTAYENVSLGVERVFAHASKSERRDTVEYYLGRVGLGDAMHKRAGELSNGMKQRVGIARAFALAPKLLLLDEPFGMLDSLTRWELQEVLMEVWSRSQVTAIMVTHDVDEAILLADRVVMMTNGPAARVGQVLDVDLPRPRGRVALASDKRFLGYRREVLEFLYHG